MSSAYCLVNLFHTKTRAQRETEQRDRQMDVEQTATLTARGSTKHIIVVAAVQHQPCEALLHVA